MSGERAGESSHLGMERGIHIQGKSHLHQKEPSDRSSAQTVNDSVSEQREENPPYRLSSSQCVTLGAVFHGVGSVESFPALPGGALSWACEA